MKTETKQDVVRLPKRVLFLTHKLDLSGVAVHIRTLVKSLAGEGIEFHIAAREMNPGKPFGLEYFQKAGVTCHVIDFPAYGLTWENFRKGAKSRAEVYRLGKELGIELVHVHAPSLAMVAYRPCKRLGIPYVTTFNIAVTGKWKTRLSRLGHVVVAEPFGAAAIAISADMAKQMVANLRIPADHVRTVPYVVDDSEFVPADAGQREAARASFGLAPDDFAVAVVAAYEPRKNHDLILDALVKCKDVRPRVVALCAGSDFYEYRPTLEKMATERGLGEHVKILGFTSSQNVFRASDAAALTSFSEGFPLAIVEAMHSGLPIIRTPAEGAAEQVPNEVNGYIVPFGDPGRLAEVFTTLARDPDRRAEMGRASREVARQSFTLKAMGDRMREIYAEAMGRTAALGS